MLQTHRVRVLVVSLAVAVVPTIGASAQPGPVAALFASEQKRAPARAPSFQVVDVPGGTADQPTLRAHLGVGDLERALDQAESRPSGVILPTNTDLAIDAVQPATQRVLISRVRQQPEVLKDLEAQIAARRSTPAAGAEGGVLRIGIDAFLAQLPRGSAPPAWATFPRLACLIATEFATGGGVDRRELQTQDRLRKGVAACLTALDAAGAQSVLLPQMGASSSEAQSNDALFEGQRTLMECRLINSVAGIALGIHDFAASRRNLREVGIVQWERELHQLFTVPAGSSAARSAQAAYVAYAAQVGDAFRRGLAGQKTTVTDLKGSCTAVLDVQ